MRAIVALWTAWALLGLAGCAAAPPSAPLTVAAASDLALAFEALGTQFERATGFAVSFQFVSSGVAAQQIENGAPVDLFASANVAYINRLRAQHLIEPNSVVRYARGHLALWTRSDGPLTLEALADPRVKRVALANPEPAPYGAAARQALERAGLWQPLQDKLILAENVRQAQQYAATGDVDVALVALSLCQEGQGRCVRLPEGLYDPIVQALAVVRGTPRAAAARAFVDFLLSPAGRSIMRRFGFSDPPQPPGAAAGGRDAPPALIPEEERPLR